MTMLKMVKITASTRAKVAYGPIPRIIGIGPRTNTTPVEAGVPSNTAEITMNMTPMKINRKLKRKSLERND